MPLLASICNIRTEFKSGLLLLDENLSGYRYLKLPGDLPSSGMTGITMSDDQVIASSQGGIIVTLDKTTLALLDKRPPQIAKDTHSILLHDGKLYAVATGLNAVVVMNLQEGKVSSERIHWILSKESFGRDTDHLNSICFHDGKLLVSGFGPKSEKLWSSAQNGFVMDIASGEKLYEGFFQPHTLTSYNGSLLICESGKSRVLDLSRGKVANLDGYVRGLCEGPEGLYAAVSKGRTVSRSTGLITTNPDDGGNFEGRSAIYLIDRDTFDVRKVLETGDLEFYDLVIVGDQALSWPVHDCS